MNTRTLERCYFLAGLCVYLAIVSWEAASELLRGREYFLHNPSLDWRGALFALIFCTLNFRLWKVLVGLMLKQGGGETSAAKARLLVLKATLIFLKALLLSALVLAVLFSTKEFIFSFLVGFTGYLLLGSVSAIVFCGFTGHKRV